MDCHDREAIGPCRGRKPGSTTKFGIPDSAKVITDRDSGQSKGFGFVEFRDGEIAKRALTLNGTDFGGRSLTVNEARPRP